MSFGQLVHLGYIYIFLQYFWVMKPLDDQEFLPDIWDTAPKSHFHRSVCFSFYSNFTIDQSDFTNICEIVHCPWQFHWNDFSRKPCRPNLVVGNVTLSVGAFSHSGWWGGVQFGFRIDVTALTHSLFLTAPGCLSICCGNTCCRSAPRLTQSCEHTQLLYKYQNYWLKTRHYLMRKHFSVKRQSKVDALEYMLQVLNSLVPRVNLNPSLKLDTVLLRVSLPKLPKHIF